MHNDQKLRYARNISLPEIGEEGQEKLLASKVLVVGAGGLGSPVLLYLAAAGVGTLGVIDSDRVELSNLQRQILHETGDVDRPKVESAADAIHDLNPDVTVHAIYDRLTADNAAKLVEGYDIVADGSDNIETRFLVHDACYQLKRTLVSAAIHRFEGQLSTYKAYLGDGHPCYRCLYPDSPPADAMPDCSESGVLGAVAGIMGSWQANEVIKELRGIGKSLSGSLVRFDGFKGDIRKTKLEKDPECILCSQSS